MQDKTRRGCPLALKIREDRELCLIFLYREKSLNYIWILHVVGNIPVFQKKKIIRGLNVQIVAIKSVLTKRDLIGNERLYYL